MSDKASVSPRYSDPRDEIVAPHHHVQLSHYYVDQWIPRLGERGHVIVTVLRRMGYINRKEGVIRDGIEIEQVELAHLCGLSLRTFQREFAQNAFLARFVQREQQYRRNTAGNIIREKTVYVVQMQDPLVDEDLPRLEQEVERREKARSRQVGGNSPHGSRQDGGIGCQVGGPIRQVGATPRQFGGNLKNHDSERNLNTSETASPPAPSGGAVELEEAGGQPQGLKKFDRAYWETQNSAFARDRCREMGWHWKGHLPEEPRSEAEQQSEE
jgi:hypothetical protein